MSARKRGASSTKVFAAAAVIVALVLAGVVSFYASASPDGLNRVAEDEGFSRQEAPSATTDSPFADYATQNVSDERLSGAIAGVAGVTVVLVVAAGIAYVVRRRPSGDRRKPAAAGSSGVATGSAHSDQSSSTGATGGSPS